MPAGMDGSQRRLRSTADLTTQDERPPSGALTTGGDEHPAKDQQKFLNPNPTSEVESSLTQNDLHDLERARQQLANAPGPVHATPSETQSEEFDQAFTPWDVKNVDQLKYWSRQNPEEFLNMLNTLRANHDLARSTVKGYEKQLGQLTAQNEELASRSNELSSHSRGWKKQANKLEEKLKELKQAQPQRASKTGDSDDDENSPTTLPKSSTPVSAPSPAKLKDTKEFTGDDDCKISYEVWKTAIIRKLTVNSQYYPDADDQMAYVLSMLGGTAANHCLVRAKPTAKKPFIDAYDILEHLDRRFEDHDKPSNNRRAYKALTQGRRPFREFYSDLLLLAGELDYSDEQIIDDLEDKISLTLRNKLNSNQGKKKSLDKLAKWLEQTDNAVRALQRDQALNEKKTPAAAVRAPRIIAKPAVKMAEPPKASKPAEVNSQLRCFTCNERGHLAKNCPHNKGKTSHVNEMDYSDPELERSDDEKEDDQTDSENEPPPL